MANKIELTWVGKEESIKVEPRLLIEKTEYSNVKRDPNSENMLIHGDNLLALKALEKDYHNQVKCIYIDPPYNANAAEFYEDNVEHSFWLSLMKSRIDLLYKMLRNDGYMFVQIDDCEQAYLTVLMDEIFGRKNHVNTICVNMNSLSGRKMKHVIKGKRFAGQKEYILLYKKGIEFSPLKIEKSNKGEWDKEYNMIIPQMTQELYDKIPEMDDDSINKKLSSMELLRLTDFADRENINIDDEWKWNNAYRIFGSKSNKPLARRERNNSYNQPVICYTNNDGNKRFFLTDYNKNVADPRIELVQADAHSSVFLSDNWTDISTDGGVAQEGGVKLPKGKKPERLIERIIRCCTEPGDLVLDSFLGSGTTAAVAHKMGRRWIGVEMGNQAYTHCKVRLDKVISGDDKTGITSTVGWEGGGGYRFYELAPSLINQDAHGEYIINKQYNAEQLAAAVALHEGFKYQPDSVLFWKQSVGTEKSYLFVTTRHLSKAYVDSIVSTMEDDEFLVIACCSYDKDIEHEYDNISVKKIPQMLLERCEFNKDDYSLTFIHPLVYEDEDDGEEEL